MSTVLVPSERLFQPHHVIAARRPEVVALLDQRLGSYTTLNTISGQIWQLAAAGRPLDEIVRVLAAKYDTPVRELQQDVEATLSSLLDRGLLVHSPSLQEERVSATGRHRVTPASNVRVPSFLQCLFTIYRVKSNLRRKGFWETLRWAREQVEKTPADDRASIEHVRRVEAAVATAGALYPGRARCLEQSLTLYLLLRAQGLAARYCQGVQFYPFTAHAWVEYGGEVVNDVPAHLKHFTRFPDQLP